MASSSSECSVFSSVPQTCHSEIPLSTSISVSPGRRSDGVAGSCRQHGGRTVPPGMALAAESMGPACVHGQSSLSICWAETEGGWSRLTKLRSRNGFGSTEWLKLKCPEGWRFQVAALIPADMYCAPGLWGKMAVRNGSVSKELGVLPDLLQPEGCAAPGISH